MENKGRNRSRQLVSIFKSSKICSVVYCERLKHLKLGFVLADPSRSNTSTRLTASNTCVMQNQGLRRLDATSLNPLFLLASRSN